LDDAADYLSERDKKYSTPELIVPAIVQQQMDDVAVAPARTIFGELMESLEIALGISQMPQGTSRPESSQIRLGSVKLQSNTGISGLEPAAERDTLSLQKVKPVAPASFYPCI